MKSTSETTCQKLQAYFNQCTEFEVWPQSSEIDKIIKENFAPVVDTRFEDEKCKYRLEIIELNRRNLELEREVARVKELLTWKFDREVVATIRRQI